MSKYKPQIINLQKLATPTLKPININPYEKKERKPQPYKKPRYNSDLEEEIDNLTLTEKDIEDIFM